LQAWLTDHQEAALPLIKPIATNIFHPLATPIGIGVMAVQILIGIAFITGRQMRPALLTALLLNVTFVAMGAISPSAFYIAIQISLLAAVDRGWLGASSRQPSRFVAAAWAVGAIMPAPFIATVNPMSVIDDPAIVLTTLGLIAAFTEVLALVEAGDDRLSRLVAWRGFPRLVWSRDRISGSGSRT